MVRDAKGRRWRPFRVQKPLEPAEASAVHGSLVCTSAAAPGPLVAIRRILLRFAQLHGGP